MKDHCSAIGPRMIKKERCVMCEFLTKENECFKLSAIATSDGLFLT